LVYAALFSNVLLTLAFMAYVVVSSRDRQQADFDHQERFNAAQERHNDIIRAIATQAEGERAADREALTEVLAQARKERDMLLDRIQRPDMLPVPSGLQEDPADEPLTIAMGDDEAEWEALGASS
jgi:hypothetical protein